MDKYLDSFREMISLRGLTDHTLKTYCTYIRAYLDYPSGFLHKSPENASWQDMRNYIKWLQASRKISDRTINCANSQLRFFTIYVLHRKWDDTQLPFRRFDTFLLFSSIMVSYHLTKGEQLEAVLNSTFHTHIYLLFQSPVRFSTIKRCFPEAHIESVIPKVLYFSGVRRTLRRSPER